MAWNMSLINQITYKPNNQVPFPPHFNSNCYIVSVDFKAIFFNGA